METIHIDRLLFPIGNGATSPIQGIANEKDYVIKTFNNVQGNKVLVNELICYLIAEKLLLPIPKAILGQIDKNTVIDKYVHDSEDFDENCYGVAFCSELLTPVTIVKSDKMLKLAPNFQWLLPKLMLFDHLIYNKDRNMGNLLISLSKKDKQLYIIDHSHTFNMESIWNSTGLYQKIDSKDYLDDYIMKNNSYHYSKFKEALKIDLITMQDTVKYFQDNLPLDFFKGIIDKVPEVWENDKDELRALSEYLIYRMEHITDFAEMILSYKY